MTIEQFKALPDREQALLLAFSIALDAVNDESLAGMLMKSMIAPLTLAQYGLTVESLDQIAKTPNFSSD